jgi:hypothetical protein
MAQLVGAVKRATPRTTAATPPVLGAADAPVARDH